MCNYKQTYIYIYIYICTAGRPGMYQLRSTLEQVGRIKDQRSKIARNSWGSPGQSRSSWQSLIFDLWSDPGSRPQLIDSSTGFFNLGSRSPVIDSSTGYSVESTHTHTHIYIYIYNIYTCMGVGRRGAGPRFSCGHAMNSEEILQIPYQILDFH